MGRGRRRGSFTISFGVGVLLEFLGALLAIFRRAARVVAEHGGMGALDATRRAALHVGRQLRFVHSRGAPDHG